MSFYEFGSRKMQVGLEPLTLGSGAQDLIQLLNFHKENFCERLKNHENFLPRKFPLASVASIDGRLIVGSYALF